MKPVRLANQQAWNWIVFSLLHAHFLVFLKDIPWYSLLVYWMAINNYLARLASKHCCKSKNLKKWNNDFPLCCLLLFTHVKLYLHCLYSIWNVRAASFNMSDDKLLPSMALCCPPSSSWHLSFGLCLYCVCLLMVY